MNPAPIKMKAEATALVDPHPQFVSLVKVGANQLPYSSVKADGPQTIVLKGRGASVVGFEFDAACYPDIRSVKSFMDSGGYEEYAITQSDDAFIVTAKDATPYDGPEVRTVKLRGGITVKTIIDPTAGYANPLQTNGAIVTSAKPATKAGTENMTNTIAPRSTKAAPRAGQETGGEQDHSAPAGGTRAGQTTGGEQDHSAEAGGPRSGQTTGGEQDHSAPAGGTRAGQETGGNQNHSAEAGGTRSGQETGGEQDWTNTADGPRAGEPSTTTAATSDAGKPSKMGPVSGNALPPPAQKAAVDALSGKLNALKACLTDVVDALSSGGLLSGLPAFKSDNQVEGQVTTSTDTALKAGKKPEAEPDADDAGKKSGCGAAPDAKKDDPSDKGCKKEGEVSPDIAALTAAVKAMTDQLSAVVATSKKSEERLAALETTHQTRKSSSDPDNAIATPAAKAGSATEFVDNLARKALFGGMTASGVNRKS